MKMPPAVSEASSPTEFQWSSVLIAGLALLCLALSLVFRYAIGSGGAADAFRADVPLLFALVVGGVPLIWRLAQQAWRGEWGSDLLAGISIVTAVLQQEYLAGTLVVLMLSGGQALEAMSMLRASSVLQALAKRMPQVAHRKTENGHEDAPLGTIQPGDVLVVFPHEVCPVDGVVLEGMGSMDESYLTGEPYQMPKLPGASVLSGAVNGSSALSIRAEKPASDSRYARIMGVMRDAEQHRPRMRRLADLLGAWYTPLALLIAILAWGLSGDAKRFLAVLVVATPCPLLIAIPVAVIGGISLCAKRGIIVKDPSALESIDQCRIAIFDKTGTLTYGKPILAECVLLGGTSLKEDEVLKLIAAVEQFSKHPLASAVQQAARQRGLALPIATAVSEPPGAGLQGQVQGRAVEVTGRGKLTAAGRVRAGELPPAETGLECIALVDGQLAALLRFRDEPRRDGRAFLSHLPRHHFERVMLVTGDRAAEAKHLAAIMGIREVYADQTPEQKLNLVRAETTRAKTLYMGDGINDAPALAAATVGVAFGQGDVTSEAARVVVMESSLRKVDELFHIGHRMRIIALQSAIGGMAMSLCGMLLAAGGLLSPVAGAISQEVIDVLAVLNALRAAKMPAKLVDLDDLPN
jgi:heavy metal translocating P-type ATPase